MTLVPPRPAALEGARLRGWRFLRIADSWLDVITARSYTMLLGHFRVPALKVFVVNDPAWVERILVDEPARYPKHRLMHEALEPLVGGSPFATNGDHWRRQRRMLDQAFSHARLALVYPLMRQACEDLMAGLHALPDGAELQTDACMTRVTADIVFRTIFSLPLEGPQAQRLFKAFTRYQELSQRTLALRLFRLPTFGLEGARRRHAQVIRNFLSEQVAQRFKNRSPQDELEGKDILAGLRTAVDEQGVALTQAEVLDQVCMLFLAGHETSASALSWCLYLLAQSPGLQPLLREEARAQHPSGISPDAMSVRRLPRLNALFKEALRLYPPVGYFPREALEDSEIRGVPVPKGSALLVFPWLMHRHRRWWTEPDAFEPDRFLDKDALPARAAYLPFGLGERACIGAGFAAMEAALILSHLLQSFSIEPGSGPPPRVVGRLTVRSDRGIRVRLRRLAP